MPLEISEIGVHVAVGSSPGSGAASGGAAPSGGDGGGAMTPAQRDAIVNACVQQVLRNLRMTEER
ncbi:MAG: DUF5908 family protein [Pseudomonadota bacterium]|uniref:DUF5908 family protein n=1 Tax=Sphingomonas sp. ERG5 TaxID=1381597 RepID=UPI00054B0292|nr:DUF5908 family protein [Sphingomonas sp. ERG5]